MSKKIPRIAICYDYDGTLIKGNMQENSFIPEVEMKKDDFWQEVKDFAKKHDMDEVLAYMYLMIDKAKTAEVGLNKQALRDHGKDVSLFPGVKDWFTNIKNVATDAGIKLEHYIISSGLTDMIAGSPIHRHFTHIFASGFLFDANEVPIFAARSVNYTTKTQYLFRINKGINNSWDNTEINKHTPQEKRPQPFSRMIYLGDGETDVPAMKMLNYQGGYSIAVYPPKAKNRIRRGKEEMKKKRLSEELVKQNRAHFSAEADYGKDKNLFNIVSSIIKRIALQEKYKMNLEASK